MSGHHAPQAPHKNARSCFQRPFERSGGAARVNAGHGPVTGICQVRNYRTSQVPSMHSRKWESAAVCAAWGRHRERSPAVGSVAHSAPAVSAAAALRRTAIRRTLPAALRGAFLLPAAITAATTSASWPFRDTHEPDIKNSRPHNANTPGPVAFRSYDSSIRAML